MNVTAVTYGSDLTFSCFEGYKLTGSLKKTCTANGTWDGKDAECTGKALFICQNTKINTVDTVCNEKPKHKQLQLGIFSYRLRKVTRIHKRMLYDTKKDEMLKKIWQSLMFALQSINVLPKYED